jgi:hypothetical protein
MYPAHWHALDEILTAYCGGLTFTFQPLLRSQRPNSGVMSLRWMMDTSAKERDIVQDFITKCHGIAGSWLDIKGDLAQLPNAIQMEYLQVIEYVARLVPWMTRTVMDSDLRRFKFLMGEMRDLMVSLESLVVVEEEAREEALQRMPVD